MSSKFSGQGPDLFLEGRVNQQLVELTQILSKFFLCLYDSGYFLKDNTYGLYIQWVIIHPWRRRKFWHIIPVK